jgi:hypothetical protein
MFGKSLLSTGLAAAVAISALVAAYAVFFRSDVSQGESENDESVTAALTPTPTAAVPPSNDLDRVRRDLLSSGSAAGEALAAIEARSATSLMATMAAEQVPCAPADSRGGSKPRCDLLGVPAGTVVTAYPIDVGGQIVLGSEAGVRTQLEAWLAREPVLSLVAEAPSGAIFCAFLVARDAGGADWISFQASVSGDKLESVRFGVETYTPIELFRDIERSGGGTYRLLAVSDEQIVREQARHDRFEEAKR